jgi:transposase-like protein
MFQYGIGFSSTTIQKGIFHKKRRICEFIVDETLIKVGNKLVWLWIATTEPKDKTVLGNTYINMSKEYDACCRAFYNIVRKKVSKTFSFN